jgi:hypothetical protein
MIQGLIALGMLVALAGFGFAAWRVKRPRVDPSAREVAQLETRRVDSVVAIQRGDSSFIVHYLRGRPHVLYFLETVCPACSSQREHVAGLLGGIDTASVLSLTIERTPNVRGYWRDIGAPLPEPLMVSQGWIDSLGVRGVPTMLFLDTDGKVRKAVLGQMLMWSRMRFKDEFAKLQ